MSDPDAVHEAHFESALRQAEASRFGMWVFLASEALLFGALFALYAGYRAEWPDAFAFGVGENDAISGSANTLVLITSSFFVAMATHERRRGNGRRGALWASGAVLLGLVFLAIKAHEYGHHFARGVFPGGRGEAFARAPMGSAVFFTLYFGMTGLHAVHVVVGLTLLSWAVVRLRSGTLRAHALEVVALYWHLVDAIWIFLWPLFYLLRGRS